MNIIMHAIIDWQIINVRARLIAGALFFALLTTGCAAYQTSALLKSRPEKLSPSAEIKGVPFFPQKAYQCGPAALAMTLNWAGAKVTPDELAPKVYIPKKHGTLQVELIAAARRYGMLAYVTRPKLADILEEVDAGHPVVVLLNLGLSWYPVWHYAVLVGYDLPHQKVVLNSGKNHEMRMPMSTFEHTWARSDYWALLTLPPSRLPYTASKQRYIEAVLALEKTHHWRSAATAYRTALTRWPYSETARMGLGNSQYALGHIKQAQVNFLRATHDHPHAAAPFNNLAQTYADQGQYRKALKAAKKAVQIGGPLIATYRETLSEIRMHLKQGRFKAADK